MGLDLDSPAQERQTEIAQPGRWLAALGFILFLALVLSYFVYHKPVGPTLIVNLAGLVIDLAVGGLILLLASALGRVLLQRWAARMPVSAAAAQMIGLVATGTTVLALGLIGLLRPYVVIPLTAVLAFGVRREIGGVLRRVKRTATNIKPSGWMEWLIASVVVVMLAGTLVDSAAPPVKFDALVYHLAMPQQFIRAGTVLAGIDNPFWGQPMLAEAHFTWIGLLTGRTASMTILGWLVGVVSLVAVYRLSDRVSGGHGWIAVAALMAGFTVWNSMGWGYADWWAILAGTAGTELLLDQSRHSVPGAGWLLGVIAGAAVAVKLTAGIFLVSALVLLLILRPTRTGLRIAVRMGAAAALIVLPWLILNLIGAGTPLYPFVGRSDWISPIAQSFYRGGGDASWLDLVLLPIRGTVLGVEGAPGFSASIGPLLAGLTAAGLVGWRQVDRRGRWVMGVVMIWWVLWAGAAALAPLLIQSRLYFVMYPAWAASAAIGYRVVAGIQLGQVRLSRLTDAVVLLVIILSGLGAMRYADRASAHSLLFGQITEDEYLTRRLGASYPAMQAIQNLRAPAGSVLMLWEPRSLYCAPTCVPDPWIARWYTAIRSTPDPLEVLSDWKAAGFQFLLTHEDGIRFVAETDERYRARDWEALAELLQALQVQESIGGSYTLYKIP